MFKFIKQIPQFFDLFKQGRELANAATWKNRTIATNIIVAMLGTLLVILQNAGIGIVLDQATLAGIGAGVVSSVAAFNAVMHTISSAKVGVSSDSGNNTDSGAANNG